MFGRSSVGSGGARPLGEDLLGEFLCIIFLLHLVYVQPFVYNVANMAESFSLFLLCIVSSISLLISVYIQMGVVPDGPNVNVLKLSRLSESLLVLLLIFFMIVFDIRNRHRKERTQRHKQNCRFNKMFKQYIFIKQIYIKYKLPLFFFDKYGNKMNLIINRSNVRFVFCIYMTGQLKFAQYFGHHHIKNVDHWGTVVSCES